MAPLFQPWHRVLFCLAVGQLLIAAEPRSQSGALLVERSPMRLRASGATYEGVTRDSVPLESLERARKLDYWVEARSGDTVFFPAHLMSSAEGLGDYRIGAGTWTSYPMFGLATAAGWYKPLPDENSFPDDIHSVTVGAGRVWMGTVGLGIVARNLRDRTWSRYDVKSGVLPGIHSFVFHADDEYVFAKSGGPSGDWKERLPDVRQGDFGPALEVYSLRRDAWLRVRGVPRENVLTFGWTTSRFVSIACDTRHFARSAWMPLEMCTWPEYVEPAPAADDGYFLGREFPDPGAPLRYRISKDQLAMAFDSLR